MKGTLLLKKNDSNYKIFRIMIVLGAAIEAGRMASEKSFQWPEVVSEQISLFQDEPVRLSNMGMGGNVLSPNSPAYEYSGKPSALERIEDIISKKPDLVILSYGQNDMRCGNPVEQFRKDYQKIISEVISRTEAVVVLANICHMTAYAEMGPHWNHGGIEQTMIYNLAIKQLAEKNGCILADIYDAQGKADWIVPPDGVHSNDLGHRLIGNRVFESIANHCPGLSVKTSRIIKEKGSSWDWEQYADWEILKDRKGQRS